MVDRTYIEKDKPFQPNKRVFAIGRTASGYMLKHNPSYVFGTAIVEADWDVYDPTGGNGEVDANCSAVIEGSANDVYRLYGNTGNTYYR